MTRTPHILAEVLDKEPGALVLVAPSLLIAVTGFFLSRQHWKFVIVSLLVALSWAAFGCSELFSPYIGGAIWRESPGYFVAVVVSSVSAIVLPVVGAVTGRPRAVGRPE